MFLAANNKKIIMLERLDSGNTQPFPFLQVYTNRPNQNDKLEYLLTPYLYSLEYLMIFYNILWLQNVSSSRRYPYFERTFSTQSKETVTMTANSSSW